MEISEDGKIINRKITRSSSSSSAAATTTATNQNKKSINSCNENSNLSPLSHHHQQQQPQSSIDLIDSYKALNNDIFISDNIVCDLLMSNNNSSNCNNSIKCCGFCHCGESTSSLGQGDLCLYDSTYDSTTHKTLIKELLRNNTANRANLTTEECLTRLQKSFENKLNSFLSVNDEKIDPLISLKELTNVGWLNIDEKTLIGSVFEDNGQVWAHRSCVQWSENVTKDDKNDLVNVDMAVLKGLKQKCSLCDNYGAAIPCAIPNCDKRFHFPCATSSGCYLEIKSLKLLCHDHLDQATYLFDKDALCAICCLNERLFEQLYCTSCGTHYHGSCLSIKIETNPVGRAGWQCPECKICQTCRQPGDDNKMLVCDICDKCYHTFCLKPQITTIPKNGWKCTNCRVCSDCHTTSCSTITTMKWHSNYTLCDFCYQQKTTQKCLLCGLCKKQLKNNKNLKLCQTCNKYVHGDCDRMSTQSSDETYSCSTCRGEKSSTFERQSSKASIDDYIYSPAFDFQNQDSKSSVNDDDSSNSNFTLNSDPVPYDVANSKLLTAAARSGLGKGKPPFTQNNGKKKNQISRSKTNRNQKRQTYSNSDKTAPQTNTRSRPSRSSKRLDSRYSNNSDGQSNCSNDLNTNSNQIENEQNDIEPTIGHIKRDEDESHAVTVLVSLEDSFALQQDMCLSCGSFGNGEEGRTIACSQCGQCFHTYCAGINKLSRVILEKGWRCLDCTVCEGCGKATDEGRLLLCDDCDISYHIYCLDPPLDHVPEGNWKCKWCIKCMKCGSKTPGSYGCEWRNNYTECEPCFSMSQCPLCNKNYKESEIILKCMQCDRWCHHSCDNVTGLTEDEADRLANDGYFCIDCKPKLNIKISNQIVPESSHLGSPHSDDTEVQSPQPALPPPKRGVLEEGVYLTDVGLSLIKKIRIKPPAPIRRQRSQKTTINDNNKKSDKQDDDLSNASSCDEKNDDLMDQLTSPNRLSSLNQDKDSSIDGQKKGGRNSKKSLKIGIGGFSVKIRSRASRPGQQQQAAGDAHNTSLEHDGNDANDEEVEKKKTVKRRKKPTIEDTFPQYMQAAFFGNDTLEKSKANRNTDPLATIQDMSDNEKALLTKRLQKNETNYSIHLDDNMIKLAQQKRKNQMDLGFEDILDGDIVNYIFSENRNFTIEPSGQNDNSPDLSASNRLKEPNDEKLFDVDDGLYEDLLSQIGLGGGPNDASEPELLHAIHTPPGETSALFNTSAFSNSDLNLDLNKSNNSGHNIINDMNNVNVHMSGGGGSGGAVGGAQDGQHHQHHQHHHHHSHHHSHHHNHNQQQQQQQQLKPHMMHQGGGGGDMAQQIDLNLIQQPGNENKHIDDLVRQFREYATNKNQMANANQPNTTQRLQPQMHPQLVQQQQQQQFIAPTNQQGFILNPQQQQIPMQQQQQQPPPPPPPPPPPHYQQQIKLSPSKPEQLMQQQQLMVDPYGQANQAMYLNPQQQLMRQNQLRMQQQQQYVNMPPQQPPQNMDQYQAMQHMQQQQQQQQQRMAKMSNYHMIDGQQQQQHGQDPNSLFNQMQQPDMDIHGQAAGWMNPAVPLQQQQQQQQQDPRLFISSQMKAGVGAAQLNVSGGSGGSAVAVTGQLDDVSKHAKVLEKFQIDEELCDFATQAMVLYVNLQFPNLKHDYPDLNERYKQVQKFWRKLDATSKQNYVNKARQNRSKKRVDDKNPATGGVGRGHKQSKSPCNSDKLSFSDADNLSRADTPSIVGGIDSNIDESLSSSLNANAANQTQFLRIKSIDSLGQPNEQQQQQGNIIINDQQVQIHVDKQDGQQQHHVVQQRQPVLLNQMPGGGPVVNLQQFRFQSPVKSSPMKMTPQQIGSPHGAPQLQPNVIRHPQQPQILLYQLQHPQQQQQMNGNEQQGQVQQQQQQQRDATDMYSMMPQTPRPPQEYTMNVQQQQQQQQTANEIMHHNSPSNPGYINDPFAIPPHTPRPQSIQVQDQQQQQQHDGNNPYQQQTPKTPSHINTPLGSPHPDPHTNLAAATSSSSYTKKGSPFSRPPSTPHSEHSLNTSSAQLIDSSPYGSHQRSLQESYDPLQIQQKQQQQNIHSPSPRMQMRPMIPPPPTQIQQQQQQQQSPQSNYMPYNSPYNQPQQQPMTPTGPVIQQSPQQQQQQGQGQGHVLFQTHSPVIQYQQNQQIITIQSPQQQQQGPPPQHVQQFQQQQLQPGQPIQLVNQVQQRIYLQQSPQQQQQQQQQMPPQSPISQQQGVRQLFPSQQQQQQNMMGFNENQMLIQQSGISPRAMMQRHPVPVPVPPGVTNQRFPANIVQSPNQQQQVIYNLDHNQATAHFHLVPAQQQQQQQQQQKVLIQQQQQQPQVLYQSQSPFQSQPVQQQQSHTPQQMDTNDSDMADIDDSLKKTHSPLSIDQQSTASKEEMSDHVDKIINDVIAGAGTIPYTVSDEDLDDCESQMSSSGGGGGGGSTIMKNDILMSSSSVSLSGMDSNTTEINDKTLQRANIMLLQLPSDDFSMQQQQQQQQHDMNIVGSNGNGNTVNISEFPPTNDPSTLKIYSILAQAKQEEQIKQTVTPAAAVTAQAQRVQSVKPQQPPQQQQVFNSQMYLQQQQQQQPRPAVMMRPIITSIQQPQQQQQQQMQQQIRTQIRGVITNKPQQLVKSMSDQSVIVGNEGAFTINQMQQQQQTAQQQQQQQQQQQWTLVKQPQTIAQMQQLQQQQQGVKFTGVQYNAYPASMEQQPAPPQQQQQPRQITYEEIVYKDVCEKLSTIEKEISSLRRKRTDLNKKNKLILSKTTTTATTTATATVVNSDSTTTSTETTTPPQGTSSSSTQEPTNVYAITELNEQQKLKYSANQQELEGISKSLANLQKQCDEYKKEQKVLQQKIDVNTKSEQEHEQRVKDTQMAKMIGAQGRLSKESQQDYDLYVQQRLQQQQQQQQQQQNMHTNIQNRPIYDLNNPGVLLNEKQQQQQQQHQQQFIQSPLSQQQQPLTPTNQLHIINQNQAITIQKQDSQQTYTIIMAPQQQQGQIQVQQVIDQHQQQASVSSGTSAVVKQKKPKQPAQKKKSIKDIPIDTMSGRSVIGNAQDQMHHNSMQQSPIMNLDFQIDMTQMHQQQQQQQPQNTNDLQPIRLIKPPLIPQISQQQQHQKATFMQQQQQPQIYIQTKPVQQQQQSQQHPIAVQLLQRTHIQKNQFLGRQQCDVQPPPQDQQQGSGPDMHKPTTSLMTVCQDENLRKMLSSTHFDNEAPLLNTSGDTNESQVSMLLVNRPDDSALSQQQQQQQQQQQSDTELLEQMQLDGTIDQFLDEANDTGVAAKKTDKDQQQNNGATSSTSPSTAQLQPQTIYVTQQSDHAMFKMQQKMHNAQQSTAGQQQQQQTPQQSSVTINHEYLANIGVTVHTQQQQQPQQQHVNFPIYANTQTAQSSPHKYVIQQPQQQQQQQQQQTATFILNHGQQGAGDLNFQQFIPVNNNIQAYQLHHAQQQHHKVQMVNQYAQQQPQQMIVEQQYSAMQQVKLNEAKKTVQRQQSEPQQAQMQQQQQQMNDYNSYNVKQVMPQSQQPPPPPSMPTGGCGSNSVNINSDNALLKQLLQTAPRNANDQQQQLKIGSHQFIQQQHSPVPIVGVKQQDLGQLQQIQAIEQMHQIDLNEVQMSHHMQQQPLPQQLLLAQQQQQLHLQQQHDELVQQHQQLQQLQQQPVQAQVQTPQKVVKKRVRKPKQTVEPDQMPSNNNMSDIKSECVDASTGTNTVQAAAAGAAVGTVVKKTRKRTPASVTHTPNKKDSLNELELTEMLDKLKRLPQIELNQPTVDTHNLPIKYPGKSKQKLSNANVQMSKYGFLSIESILNMNDGKPLPKSSADCDSANRTVTTTTTTTRDPNESQQQELMKRYFEKRFKVCNATIDSTSEFEGQFKAAAAKPIVDSSKRIKYLIDSDSKHHHHSPLSPVSDTCISSSSIDDEANYDECYLSSLYEQILINNPMIRHHNHMSYREDDTIRCIKNEPSASSLPSTSVTVSPMSQRYMDVASPVFDLDLSNKKIYSIKEEPVFNHHDEQSLDQPQSPPQKADKVSVTLTLTKEAANDIRSVMSTIAELLSITLPTNWDMGTISTAPIAPQIRQASSSSLSNADPMQSNINSCLNSIRQQIQQQQLQANILYKLNRETGFSINTIINQNCIKTCKFCDSVLLDEHEYLTKRQADINKLVNYPQCTQSAIASSSSSASASTTTTTTAIGGGGCGSNDFYFCTDACLASYVRLLNLQYKQRILMESFQMSNTCQNEGQPNGGSGLDGQQCASSSFASCSSPHLTDLFATSDDLDHDKKTSSRHKRKPTDSMMKFPPEKRWKGLRWRKFDPTSTLKTIKLPNNKDIDELMTRLDVNVKNKSIPDKRVCTFCQNGGDQDTNGLGRLLVMDVDVWAHLNCALWSTEVYETMNGALINVDVAYKRSLNSECCVCHVKGASIKCFSQKCNSSYHLICALKEKCVFFQDKTVYCATHAPKPTEHNVVLSDLAVHRKVWIQRNEVGQIQDFMSSDLDDINYAIRIGSLVLYNIGQLLPHQIKSSRFHNRDFIYPVGYKATRFYWSFRRPNKRCRYQMTILENDGGPEFSVVILDDGCEPETISDSSPSELWNKILFRIVKLRKDNELINMFPVYFSGEFLFGLTEPHIVRLIESLPGIEMLNNYAFKFGKLQLLDMPLTINPTGCARSEPKLRTHFRPHRTITCSASSGGSSAGPATRSASNAHPRGGGGGSSSSNSSSSHLPRALDVVENPQIPYLKQFVLSKPSQYKKLKAEWRSNVYLAKSRIQGLGLYAAKDLEKHSMVIEYIGESIRNEVANRREQLYDQQNRGIYMFRLDDDRVIDATICGGLARYVNHCCNPNCIAEIVSLTERDSKIIIIASRRIQKGEELTYDYKFDYEDESNKIPCLCGAPNCKKWMN